MNKLLVVVDLVNGFINEGEIHDKHIRTIIPECKSLIESYLNNGYPVIAFKDCHTHDDEEFKDFPIHCIKGTEEAELVDEIKVFEDRMIVIEKNTTNGFTSEGYQKVLKDYVDYDEILVVGCCTDICVLQFVMEMKMLKTHFDLKYKLIVAKDACDTFEMDDHHRDDFNDRTFELLEMNDIEVVDHYEL